VLRHDIPPALSRKLRQQNLSGYLAVHTKELAALWIHGNSQWSNQIVRTRWDPRRRIEGNNIDKDTVSSSRGALAEVRRHWVIGWTLVGNFKFEPIHRVVGGTQNEIAPYAVLFLSSRSCSMERS
jgi:hypothetical protein